MPTTRKVHFIKPGAYGLFAHHQTYCDQSVDYVRDCWMRHYQTHARFDYTNDWRKITCKTCRKNYEAMLQNRQVCRMGEK